MAIKPVSIARSKTRKVQQDISVAESELHESNQVLVETGVGKVATAASVKKAVAQNIEVEGKLHDAVDELAAVSALLKIAEKKAAGQGEEAAAGHRSGEGIDSVMAHLGAAAKGRERRDKTS